ncbi:hypothetical protein IAI53_07610 [Thauera sp. CAU 1555]|uniref:Uncharacterized protein n=1 Tax=Thauera sedimentorum TaxID=2767595 RepID=A0ABR9B998_9RHOO|nr:hypothetical protein [Thauera sedimentorum]MBC9071832.1 hypothetical protein [Thauera sedimentorum]MBD8502751.1 hypothetical protein [Thauera sedimentorum]
MTKSIDMTPFSVLVAAFDVLPPPERSMLQGFLLGWNGPEAANVQELPKYVDWLMPLTQGGEMVRALMIAKRANDAEAVERLSDMIYDHGLWPVYQAMLEGTTKVRREFENRSTH